MDSDRKLFGALLTQVRKGAGVRQQRELAVRLGASQQKISRWESGASMPTIDQLGDLARALNLQPEDADALITAAASVADNASEKSSDGMTWPLDGLNEYMFEQFCAELAKECFPEAQVNQHAHRGLADGGTDVIVKLGDGSIIAIQCKRVASFGPQAIKEAVAAKSIPSQRNILMLASLATPKAIAEIHQHANWELWDRAYISSVIRRLDKEIQIRLADTYFKRRRYELTGELDASSWLKPNEFFAPIDIPGRNFTQSLPIVGRDDLINELVNSIKSGDFPVILLIGNGGAGKTRLLKAVADTLTASGSNKRVYFHDQGAIDSTRLADLPPQSVLVCDDAHNRDDLRPLCDFVARQQGKFQLILSLRAYGLNRVLDQTPFFELEDMKQIRIPSLSEEDATEVAKQALIQFEKPEMVDDWANQLGAYTRDCPLAAVIGAQTIASGANPGKFLFNETTFRAEMMRRLVSQVVKDISAGMNSESISDVLYIVAITQPIVANDPKLNEFIANYIGKKQDNVPIILNRLLDAGVLFQRDSAIRVSPDLLGDFLIEEKCIDRAGASTGVAERMYDDLPPAYGAQLFLNMARADWIRRDGNTSQSAVMNDLWNKASQRPGFMQSDKTAIAAVAYYQPHRALDFIERAHSDQLNMAAVPGILQFVARNPDYRRKACQELWIRRHENFPSFHGENTDPIKILAELAAPGPNKPINQVETVVDFALRQMEFNDSWEGVKKTPLDVLQGALVTEGYTTSSSLTEVQFKSYGIRAEAVREVRERIIKTCIALLHSEHLNRACKAADVIGHSLRYPMGMFNAKPLTEEREQWANEFESTLNAIDASMQDRKIHPVAFHRLATAIRWHAQHAEGQLDAGLGSRTSIPAKNILGHQGADIRTQIINMMMGGCETALDPKEYDLESYHTTNLLRKAFAEKVLQEISDISQLVALLDDCLKQIAFGGYEPPGHAHIFLDQLGSLSVRLAEAVATAALIDRSSNFAHYLGTMVRHLLLEQQLMGTQVVELALQRNDKYLMEALSDAYATYYPNVHGYTEKDKAALRAIVSSRYPLVVKRGADSIHHAMQLDFEFAIELIATANFEERSDVAGEYMLALCNQKITKIAALPKQYVTRILHKLAFISELSDYWVQEFLVLLLAIHPLDVLDVFTRRIQYALKADERPTIPFFNAIPFPTPQLSFDISNHEKIEELTARLFLWARSLGDNAYFLYYFGELTKLLFGRFNTKTIQMFKPHLNLKDEVDLRITLALLGAGEGRLVFSDPQFIEEIVIQARGFGSEMYEHALSCLYSSTVQSSGNITFGLPDKEMIRLQQDANTMLDQISYTNPTRQLYQMLYDHAAREIKAIRPAN